MTVIRVRRRGGAPEGHGQLLEPRQVLQILQSENLQERRCGAVQQRAAEPFPTGDHLDEPALDELVHDGTRVDAADLVNLEPTHRLAVRDDGQRLECGG